MSGTEGADDGDDVLMLGVHGVVEATHVGGGEFASEVGEGGSELRELREGGLPDDGDSVVGREVVAVVFEGNEAEGVDEAVGGVAGDDVDLMIDKGAIDQAEIHDAGLPGEVQGVAFGPAAEAVGALEEFVADAGAPLGGEERDVGNFLKMKFIRVVAADDHGECVFEAEGLGDFEMEAIGVELLDAAVDGGGIALRRFIEDRGEGRAGVFDVEVERAGFESFVDEQGAAEVGFALNGDAGLGFNVLGEEFGEDDLLGKEFGADGDFGWMRRTTRRRIERSEQQKSEERVAHVRWKCPWEKKEFNTESTENTEDTEKRKKKEKSNAETQSAQRRLGVEEKARRLRRSLCSE